MGNSSLQFAGLCIMLLLLYFSLRQKSLHTRSAKLFLMTLMVSIACVCLDMGSLSAIEHQGKIPQLLLEVICKSYLVSLVLVGRMALLYINADMKEKKGVWANERFAWEITGGAGIGIYLLPIGYYYEGDRIYTYGPGVYLTYIAALTFVFVTLYRVFRYYRFLSGNRARAIRSWMFLWIVTSGIQLTHPSLLLVGFATSLGMVILFFELENPEANIERATGVFNAHALLDYMKQKYDAEEKFSVLSLYVEESVQTDDILGELIQYLHRVEGALLFKRVERELVLVFDEYQALQKALENIRSRFARGWCRNGENDVVMLKPVYLVLPDSTLLANERELLRILSLCRMENDQYRKSPVIFIDENVIRERQQKDEMAKTIQLAMDEDRVEVFYQPIYGVKEQCFVAAEALVRIRNTDGSLLSPGHFIPIAEENGSVNRLGEIVFAKTCHFLHNYNITQMGMRCIDVNLSVEQCEQEHLADRYIHIMKEFCTDPSQINLEITETASIKTRKNMLKNMEKLIAYGVEFSLDDFGNGESNLNYIVDMPIQVVKFDYDMTQAYFQNRKAKSVMNAAKEMIHDIGLKIVSEGVETKEQAEVLSSSIDFLQGYYFAKPMPENEFLAFIKKQQC